MNREETRSLAVSPPVEPGGGPPADWTPGQIIDEVGEEAMLLWLAGELVPRSNLQ